MWLFRHKESRHSFEVWHIRVAVSGWGRLGIELSPKSVYSLQHYTWGGLIVQQKLINTRGYEQSTGQCSKGPIYQKWLDKFCHVSPEVKGGWFQSKVVFQWHMVMSSLNCSKRSIVLCQDPSQTLNSRCVCVYVCVSRERDEGIGVKYSDEAKTYYKDGFVAVS